jgi:DNA-binding transcriptional ArsR family regulator
MQLAARADLFRLLGDEDRLRLLALCSEEELTVGELAALLGESQPQVTKKSQPLREVGLVASRRDGNRTLLRSQPATDPVIEAALEEGRLLCTKDGSLSRIAGIVAQREELSKRFFEEVPGEVDPIIAPHELVRWLPMFAPLLPGRDLAIDLGTGDGALLPILSALYTRVIAVDRSASRLARCSARIAAWGLPNVRLREGDADDAGVLAEVDQRSGADLVVMARLLRYASRPQEVIASATRMLRPGAHLAIVDHVAHDDETMREQGHVWLGFEPAKLRTWIDAAGLDVITVAPMPGSERPPHQIAIGKKPSRVVSLKS